jgi:hypothetical protein
MLIETVFVSPDVAQDKIDTVIVNYVPQRGS